MIDALNTLGRDAFVHSLSSNDVFLFVHGFNVSFQESIFRVAQLKHDLNLAATPLVFSWPSAANVAKYDVDEERNKESIPKLAECLLHLSRAAPNRKVHVLAHSMGNRLLMNAVQLMVAKKTIEPGAKLFGRVAICAPDVAPTDFAMLCPALVDHSDAVTFYYALNDKALFGSRLAHLDEHAGQRFFYFPGMETVNATEINPESDWLGHGYYASSPYVRFDLRLYYLFGLKADRRRPPLRPQKMTEMGFPYWEFDSLVYSGNELDKKVIELTPSSIAESPPDGDVPFAFSSALTARLYRSLAVAANIISC